MLCVKYQLLLHLLVYLNCSISLIWFSWVFTGSSLQIAVFLQAVEKDWRKIQIVLFWVFSLFNKYWTFFWFNFPPSLFFPCAHVMSVNQLGGPLQTTEWKPCKSVELQALSLALINAIWHTSETALLDSLQRFGPLLHIPILFHLSMV